MTLKLEPYTLAVDDDVLEDLRLRLSLSRLPGPVQGAGWSYGMDRDVLRAFLDYWRDEYDWRAVEARINGFDGFTTEAQGERMHFIHVRSPEPDAVPLVITHGWPGSVAEFFDVIGPLSDPRAHGGDPADAFHVVCPSMPGYALSGPTRQPGIHINRVTDAIAEIVEALGYERYIAQGGDWGAIVTRRLGEAYAERLLGVHFNMLFCFPPDMSAPEAWDGVTDAERARFAEMGKVAAENSGYMHIQGTKPDALGYGLNDSPTGLAAWILEKFYVWSDCDGDLESVYTKDQLLTNVMLYWITGTAASAGRLYCESMRAGCFAGDPWDGRVDVPTGYAVFPREIMLPARAWADKRYNIVHWTEQERGGHFAALERPRAYVDDVRAFARLVR